VDRGGRICPDLAWPCNADAGGCAATTSVGWRRVPATLDLAALVSADVAYADVTPTP
jgi:hypothetical protein